jgi:hypothetical protein
MKFLLIVGAAGVVIYMLTTGQGGDLGKSIARGVGFGLGHEAVHLALHHH